MNRDDYLEFLDNLRESGETNMFGAGEYIQEQFHCTKQEAKEALMDWMKTFEERHPN